MSDEWMPVATRYEFAPAECFAGEPMDTADRYPMVPICVQWRGGGNWAITRGANSSPTLVWCESSGDWEYEPLPSSREDDFIERTRYSLDTALAIGHRLANAPKAVTS